MSSKREQLKTKLMVELEGMVEEALSQGEAPLTLEEIEDLALTARDQMAQSLTGSLAQQQSDNTKAELPSCPDCGQAMRPKGKKGRHLRTRSGSIRLERNYFYCEACGSGHFPPG